MGLLTDTHCHLNLPIFQKDIEEILDRAWEAGVSRILIPGIDIETSQGAIALAEQHKNLYAAVGIHPSSANSWSEETLPVLRDLVQHPKTIAVGEIGLDYYRDRAPRPLQRDVFRAQLELAGEQNLPVIVHNRESFDDLFQELSDWQEELHRNKAGLAQHPGVLHSFDGSQSQARQVAEEGFYLGISGPVTYKNAVERQNTAAGLPLDRILIETDAPYLPPHPHRGERNEPAYVTLVAEKVSSLHGISLDAAAQATWENAAQLLNWGVNP